MQKPSMPRPLRSTGAPMGRLLKELNSNAEKGERTPMWNTSSCAKALISCIFIEFALFAFLWLFTRSTMGAIVASAVLFGPASLLFGPAILGHFKTREAVE